jgi:CMP-N-acetylneuraminic acid synthetase
LVERVPSTHHFSYYNTCGGAETGGDDGDIKDPNLPAVPGATSEHCKRDMATFMEKANCKLPRVDWKVTAETCSEDEMQTIFNTQLKAIEIMKETGSLEDAFETTGFNRYFVTTDVWKNNDLFIKQNSTLYVKSGSICS